MLIIGWSKLVDGIHRVCSKQVEKDAGDGAMKDEREGRCFGGGDGKVKKRSSRERGEKGEGGRGRSNRNQQTTMKGRRKPGGQGRSPRTHRQRGRREATRNSLDGLPRSQPQPLGCHVRRACTPFFSARSPAKSEAIDSCIEAIDDEESEEDEKRKLSDLADGEELADFTKIGRSSQSLQPFGKEEEERRERGGG